MAFFLLRHSSCLSWGDQSSCLQNLFFFCKSLPRLLKPFLDIYKLFKHGRGWQRDNSSPKAWGFFVMCILTEAHFVAAPSQVEPTEGEKKYLFLKETIVHSELCLFCTLNDTWGPLIVCQLLWFQKDKEIQHSRELVGLMVIRHHANCKEQKSGKYCWKTGKAEMM